MKQPKPCKTCHKPLVARPLKARFCDGKCHTVSRNERRRNERHRRVPVCEMCKKPHGRGLQARFCEPCVLVRKAQHQKKVRAAAKKRAAEVAVENAAKATAQAALRHRPRSYLAQLLQSVPF